MTAIGHIGRSIRRLTLVEWLAIILIVTVFVALLLPAAQWASSGDIEVPVRVLVFDAASATPIAGARVGIQRAPPWFDEEFLTQYRESLDLYGDIRDADQEVTSNSGIAVIDYRFRTGASHQRPTPHAHTNWVWVAVQAEGYGGAVIPVRHESLPTPKLREQDELRIPIGLLRSE